MSIVKFGPAGLGSIKDAINNLDEFHEKGLRACEIPFTYGVYIKKQEDAEEIGEHAKKLGISLSIHAQYWINLNSAESEKIDNSKKRIIECLNVGTWLGAKYVVFHPGFYGKSEKDETYEKIKEGILELQKIRKEKKYTPKLAPETTGKINVFGSIEEISKLVGDTGCAFTIDFAHILAREKNYNFDRVKKFFGKHKTWHIHFSGIEYSEKGERKHKLTETKEWKKVLEHLPKDTKITIINESPDPLGDAVKGLEIYDKMKM